MFINRGKYMNNKKMCFLNIDFERQNYLILPFCQNMRHIEQNTSPELSPSTRRRQADATALTPCCLQLHRNRCHSLSPPLTSNTGSSQQPVDNCSSSRRSAQREKAKTDTTEPTFNLYEATETEPGEGRDKTARWAVGGQRFY